MAKLTKGQRYELTIAMIEAAQRGDIEEVRQLLRDGVPVNGLGLGGETALDEACSGGRPDVALMLLGAGADPNATEEKWTPLMKFLGHAERPDVVEALLAAGVDVNVVYEHEHQTALDMAIAYGLRKSARLIRKAGGKTADEVAPIEEIEEERWRASWREATGDDGGDELPMADVPDFREAGKSAGFRAAAAGFAEAAGAKANARTISGARCYTVANRRAKDLIARQQAALLKKGAYLVRMAGRESNPKKSVLALLPTRRWEDVVALAQVSGVNYDVGSADVVRALKRVAKKNPFVITAVGADLVSGRFLGPVKEAAGLAKAIHKLAPDVVSQGTETVAALARDLAKKRELFLWWD